MTKRRDWALVLGASSGFGQAAAVALARQGYNIFGVHLDRRSSQPQIDSIKAEIEGAGGQAVFFNTNAAAAERRQQVLTRIADQIDSESQVHLLLHSLAFGSLKPFVPEAGREDSPRVEKSDLDMTLDVMANSLLYWVQGLVQRQLMRKGGRVFAMTSAGSRVVWKSYGAVSAAKAALESHCRQLAVELAPMGITANAILAGVTDTPALRKIPGHEQMIEMALARHPSGRLTRPEDVANAIALLSRPEAQWITGNTIHVDGGETIAG